MKQAVGSPAECPPLVTLLCVRVPYPGFEAVPAERLTRILTRPGMHARILKKASVDGSLSECLPLLNYSFKIDCSPSA